MIPDTMLEKFPHDMNRAELLAYVQMLEQKVEYLNATVRKAEADAVVTVAALVHLHGDEAIIPIEMIAGMSDYQISRITRPEDNATVFSTRKRPAPEGTPEVAPEPGFKPDGL